MGKCVSAIPPEQVNGNGVSAVPVMNSGSTKPVTAEENMYKPVSRQARQLEYPTTVNEVINNPYSVDDWIEVQERISMQFVVATVIDKQNNWIRCLSQSPHLLFTDKYHVVRDSARIRALGAASNSVDIPHVDDKELNELDDQLDQHGLCLVSEIKYDDDESSTDSIYKSFQHRLHRNTDQDTEFKQNVLEFMQMQENDAYFQSTVLKYNEKKENQQLLAEQDVLRILSRFAKLNVILYQFDNCDLQPMLNDNDNEDENEKDEQPNTDNIYLLHIAKTKHYKLMKLTMRAIVELVHDPDSDEPQHEYTQWSTEQVIKWLHLIEFGFFDQSKFDLVRDGVQKLEINGVNIVKMNDLTLRSMGVTDECDQKLLTENIEKLASTAKGDKADENAGKKKNHDIIEEEQESDGAMVGGVFTQTPGNSGLFGGNQQCDYFEIPQEYLDPIHYTIMRDPVLSIVSGHTFERASIVEWINENHSDPINQKRLETHQLVANRTLREAIDRFIQQYGSQLTETKR